MSAYLLLWSKSGPWLDGSGYMAALTLPGFEPPPVGFEGYRESFLVRLQYWAPYLAYALACTLAAAGAIWVSQGQSLRSVALGAVSAAFLLIPWIVHWAICRALPLGWIGCFSWGDAVPLLVFFTPKIAPLAGMGVAIAKAEEWVAAPRPR